MFNFFKKKKEPKNLKEVLKQFKILEDNLKEISSEIEKLKQEQSFSIQKIGLLRFNPFPGMGGNQSFSLALLNSYDDGVVITSLYTREGNRIYSKTIKQGRSPFPLSSEEIKAIEMAKNYGQKTNNNNRSATRGGGTGSY
ncbi:MAG: DUF4446 family protein [Minisyncoccales bacterium]